MDAVPAKIDTVYSLSYRASKGDKAAQKLFKISKRKVYSDEEKRNEMLSRLKAMQAEEPGLRSGTAPVQEIPMQESFSPAGAITYSIPIATASGCKFAPNISLVYNSQAGNGVAGFGWEIAGLSRISVRNNNLYYDDETRAAVFPDIGETKWSLDGEPLVRNEDIASFPGFQYQTAKGRIMVKYYVPPAYDFDPHHFTALYPNGQTAYYGISSHNIPEAVYYCVSELQDQNGYRIFVDYIASDYNCPAVSSIRYGGKTYTESTSHIVFTYQSGRTDIPLRYVAGGEVMQTRLLKSITSYDGNEEICTYTLTHTLKDSVYLLTRIDCSRGNSQLQPLLFDYGTTGSYEDAGIALADTTSLGAGYDNSGDQYYNYVRGKFLPGKSDDGVLSYEKNDIFLGAPSFSPVYYYCGYSPTSSIYVSPKLDTLVSCTDTLKAGNWFQAVAAADVDGDGTDEIVKVNVGNCRSGYTDLLVTVRRYDASSLSSSTVIYPVSIKGSKKSGNSYYPYQRAYYFGDFLGNGKTQLLVFCYSKNVYGQSQTNTSALISLDNGVSVLSDEVITGCNYVNDKSILVADIDGDGKVELCDFFTNSDDSGYANIYRSDNEGHFSQQETINGMSSTILKDSDQSPFLLDHNGDGYLDIIVPPKKSTTSEDNGDTWSLYTGNGITFAAKSIHICKRMLYMTTSFHWQSGVEYRNYDDHYFFTDVTSDGIADMVRVRLDQIVVFKGTPGGFESTPMPVTAALEKTERGLVPQNVVRYDGKASVICVDGTAVKLFQGVNTSEHRRSLFCSQDSFGRQRQYDYSNMASRNGAYSDSSFVFSPYDGYALFCAPLSLVERARLFGNPDPGAPVLADKRWTYTNAVWHREGLGFRGFERVGCSEPIADRFSLTTFAPRMFGVPTVALVSRDSARADTVSVSRNFWEVIHSTYGKERPRLYYTNSYNSLSGLRVLQGIEYDSYDNPTVTVTSRSTNLGDVKTDTVQVAYLNNFTSSSGHYVLGAAYEENLYLGGWRKCSTSSMDSLFRPVRTKEYAWRTSTTDSLRTLTDTRFEYDQNGNVSRKRVSTHGTGDYLESTYTYDSAGRHLISETDPLGLTTTYSNYNVFGKPASATDPKGRTTSYTYDYWGTLVRTDNPDGSWTSQSTSWCSGEEPGLYKVESQDAAGAMTCSFFDALGRETLSANKRFDGQWQCRKKEYNSKGQIARVSLPYRRNAPADTATALIWNNYLYDAYGRDTCILEASGRKSRTIYNQSVTTTVRDSIVSTNTVDALGRTFLIHDAGGDIVYSYRPDGNPYSVSVHSGVVTSFGYNAFGERSYIDDPSLGIQTDSIAWSSDGSSVATSTNVYGTSISSYDRYGRLMSVQKIGQDTVTYAYDAYNLLTGLSSTNGTAISYSYDNYDRLASTTEYHGTDSLRTAYAYNASGQLASKTYTSNYLFAPVSENYTYSNGHNTKTTAILPESYSPGEYTSMTVKQLLAENEFGQPTSVQVCSDTRSYAYDQFGFPASRCVGPGRTETYSYDHTTGNMVGRTIHDDWLSSMVVLQDSFTYDALGRLSCVSSSPTAAGGTAGSATYDGYSNATQIADAASMQYSDSQHPYTLTSYTASDSEFQRSLTCSYNVDGKPAFIENTAYDATISYGCNGERTSTLVNNKSTGRVASLRQYFGGEMEVYGYPNYGSSQQGYRYWARLYLGGDFYSGPLFIELDDDSMEVLVYSVWRDNLGSVRDECLMEEGSFSDWEPTSYDSWGRARAYYDGIELLPVNWLTFTRGFGGHEYLPWFGVYNANARLYDPLLGRFLTPDPYVQAPGFSVNFNRYAYCLNNPLKYTDFSGEFIFSLYLGPVGAVIDAACWGAVIGGASYTASIAFSDGGFNNWKWSDFGKTVGWGAVSGAATFGVGEGFSALGDFAGAVGTELLRSATHGLIQGGMSYFQGGSFWHGFSSGMLGSLVASGYSALGIEESFGTVGMLTSSALAGGFGSVMSGDSFWKGACVGLTTAGLNHLQHKTEEIKFFHRLRRHYHKGGGKDFILNEKEFNYLIKKGHILYDESAIADANGYYSANIDFYDSGFDLKYSFGTARIKYYIDNCGKTQFAGFYDYYNFDAKPWGIGRSYGAEIITRAYGTLPGNPFKVYFNKIIF